MNRSQIAHGLPCDSGTPLTSSMVCANGSIVADNSTLFLDTVCTTANVSTIEMVCRNVTPWSVWTSSGGIEYPVLNDLTAQLVHNGTGVMAPTRLEIGG